MNKKNIAIILEIIPIISAPISYILITSPYNSKIAKFLILTSFLGFVFFFIGRKLNKENKVVKVLGILDWLATLYVVLLYTIVIFIFGLWFVLKTKINFIIS